VSVRNYLEIDAAAAARTIATYHYTGHHHRIPLVRAATAGKIALLDFGRGASRRAAKLALAQVRRAGLPIVLIIADDEYGPAGPSAWPVADLLLKEAKLAVIHGGGGLIEQYEDFVVIAQKHGVLLVVETSTVAIKPWVEFAQSFSCDILIIAPFMGMHPAAPVQQ
jgi:hypothetical protein